MTNDEQRIMDVLRTHPKGVTGFRLFNLTGLSVSRFYFTLYKLESHGMVSSEWITGPYPRQRNYTLGEHYQ